ncbi:uncharacterized protein LOC104900395 [Beta vulgaris subsp. vulgaris]|uniref:uncharacterized protein LOC104900395 n=1 Tax=Beta vulgaris subsp. vulgaris TaxID=3555 RepID=UPI00053F762C|nr:uncharacterized protein LOC104900395 [Beta vulgaris subsp. vulgaris]
MAPKERTLWTPKTTETFLDLCLENKNGGNTKYDWDTIKILLNAQTGENFEKKVVENYYNDCRNRFKAWYELKTKWTGIGWDENTGCPTIDPHDEKWKAFVQMFELFGGTFATGSMAWSINSTGPSLFDKGKMVDVDEGSGDSDDGEVNGDKGYDDEDDV